MNGDGTHFDNPNPLVKRLSPRPSSTSQSLTLCDRIFDVIRDIRDPEHPHSLEELSVVDKSSIVIIAPASDSPCYGVVQISFTPTVPHCSLASIIGLSIILKLQQSLTLEIQGEHYYKLKVLCVPDAHAQAKDINRQLRDKERVSAAFENPKIMRVLNECINNLP